MGVTAGEKTGDMGTHRTKILAETLQRNPVLRYCRLILMYTGEKNEKREKK